MHWFWRVTIAVVVGGLCGTVYLVQNLSLSGPFFEITNYTLNVFRIIYFISPWYKEIPICFPFATLPIILSFGIYGILTYIFAREPIANETRCRKCGYILRGIREPICSECGEKI
jgi:hypothetical protein